MKLNHARKMFVLSCTMLLLGGCQKPAANVAAPESQTETTVAVQKEESVQQEELINGTVTILHVNDIHGYVEASDTAIGYPKIAGFIEQTRAKNPNTIVLDAGDTFAGNPLAAFDKGESVTSILNTMGIDAMTAGNHDYYLGKERLSAISEAINYPMLTGNVVTDAGDEFLDGYTILTLDNKLKVGIISLTTPASSAAGLVVQDAVERAEVLVAEVRTKVDIIVGLFHLGYIDASNVTSLLVAEKVDGFDAIIDGHSHTVLESGEVVNGVLLAQTGEYSNYIGVVELEIKNSAVESATARLVGKDDLLDVPEKAETAAALAALIDKSTIYFAEEVGETVVDLFGGREYVRLGESNMGNLVADAMREKTGADFAFINAGAVGGDIPAGVITKGDVFKIARISDKLSLVERTGAEIVEELNYGVSLYPDQSGYFKQVSGLTYKFDPEAPVDDRVHSVMIGGEPIDLEKTYTVALSFGDTNVYGMSEEVYEEYIREHSPVSPEVEGRIVIEAKP